MSVTDSIPTFKARAAALGLAEDVIELFMDAKVDTLSKYAFCSSYVPGQSNETEFLTALKAIMKRDASVGELSCLRRLLHEAYSMSAAELKQVVERTEDMPAKKLAQPERAHRLDTQQRRLTGFKIEGPLEPADRLIDLVVQQYEENRVYHVDLHKCPSKEQEVLSQGSKEDRNITIDALGNVRVKGKDAKVEADLASDILLRNAFTRRALAYDQANLVDFVKLNSWTERLLQARLVDPPPGYARITQNQIIQADRKLWVKIAELTRDGVQIKANGRPIDLIFDRASIRTSCACSSPYHHHPLFRGRVTIRVTIRAMILDSPPTAPMVARAGRAKAKAPGLPAFACQLRWRAESLARVGETRCALTST